MRSSIKSRLFLLTYGVILAFIVGLIVLNNTFLERYYTKEREKTLIFAFEEVKKIPLNDLEFSQKVMEVEQAHNIMIQILYEPYVQSPPNPEDDFTNLTPPYTRLFGNPFFLRDHVIVQIITEFSKSESSQVNSQAMSIVDEAGFLSYLAELSPTNIPNQNQFRILALCVQETLDNNDYIYYIMTVSFQSIRDNIAIFNAFTIFVGVIFMFISGFVMYFTSYQFTTPILAMNQVTQDLANLDFSQKVVVKTNDELGDLGDSINKMSSQLESSIKALQEANQKLEVDIELKTRIDDMRKEFIASASHELKTPISLILGYSEALKLTGLDQQTIEEYLNIIIDESNKMNKLVMGLLKLSQLESGFQQVNITCFDVRHLVEETVNLVQILLDESSIHTQIIGLESFEVESDYDALQTVLSNYLTNAIHYVDDRLRITIRLIALEDGWIRVEVENTGKPIEESQLARVWDSFYKIDKARTRQYGGQGLGLSIVKNTLTNLGYRYQVNNTKTGVCFSFDISPIYHME
jgi:two-component system sensor histidine kinase VanS